MSHLSFATRLIRRVGHRREPVVRLPARGCLSLVYRERKTGETLSESARRPRSPGWAVTRRVALVALTLMTCAAVPPSAAEESPMPQGIVYPPSRRCDQIDDYHG